MPADFGFHVIATDGRARRGRVRLAHGEIETPVFMPVGTRAAVKGLTHDQIIALDPEIILANTYHLHLRPGDELGLETLATHRLPLSEAPEAYRMFQQKTDGCLKVVLHP